MKLLLVIILQSPLEIAAIAYILTMGPLYRAAAARPQVRLRFKTSDVFCLLFQVLLLLSAAAVVLRPWKAPVTGFEMNEDKSSIHILIALALPAFICAAWLSPVHSLNRAEVFARRVRGLVLLIIAPLSLAGSFALGVCCLGAVACPNPLAFAIAAVSSILALSGLHILLRAVVSENKT
jgi:hypothetical protein